jgi:DeoR family transcriptional regulator of aga operon
MLPFQMRRVERISSILEQLSSDSVVDVTELADRLGVSQATIRRDLRLLEGQRLLSRTHGGAVAQDVSYELPLRYRSARRHEQKQRIADEAARRVNDGAAIGLTGGTTTTEVARAIAHRDLTVVTNALNIATELVIRQNIKLVVTGGVARPESYELVGPLAEQSLSGLNLDVVFVGADGITPGDGLTTHHETEAHTDRRLLDRARLVVAVADGSKLGRVAFARICPISAVHELITDSEADPRRVAALDDAGLKTTVV